LLRPNRGCPRADREEQEDEPEKHFQTLRLGQGRS
jgi:hypothetical protein